MARGRIVNAIHASELKGDSQLVAIGDNGETKLYTLEQAKDNVGLYGVQNMYFTLKFDNTLSDEPIFGIPDKLVIFNKQKGGYLS